MASAFVPNGAVRLRVLDSARDGRRAPVLVVPGMGEHADEYTWCAVLAIRGGARGAVLTDELAHQWRTSRPSVELATIAAAGHDLWSRDPDTYLATLLPFLERCDTD